MTFNPKKISAFSFKETVFNEKTLELSLKYSFDDKYNFEEIYTFHSATLPKDEASKAALDKTFMHLHLMAGVSYYKAAIPSKIETPYTLSEKTAGLFNELYTQGLGEFAYKNKLSLDGKIKFPFKAGASLKASEIPLPRKTVIPVGGGKDSVVTVEILKSAKEPAALFVMGDNKTIHKVAGISKLPVIHVSRKISPMLLQLNSEGAYNGHVPISAILSFLLAASSILYGLDTIAMSYEHSASSPTLEEDGRAVNHQYSKSLECERLLQEYIGSSLLSNLTYFSMIRPLSELAVASIFSRHTDYHQDFTSCNGHFRQGENNNGRWCNDCPKCRFVFLALAPFIEKDSLTKIFGKNLLDDSSQLKGFEELAGYSGHKPFECVGETAESRYALKLLLEKPEWQDARIIKALKDEIIEFMPHRDYLNFSSDDHLMPARFKEILDAYIRS